MEFPNEATENELKEGVVDIKKKYDDSEAVVEAPWKSSLIFQ